MFVCSCTWTMSVASLCRLVYGARSLSHTGKHLYREMLVFDVLYLEQGQIYTFDNGLDCYGEDNILSHISITDVNLQSASHSLLFYCRSCKRRQRGEKLNRRLLFFGVVFQIVFVFVSIYGQYFPQKPVVPTAGVATGTYSSSIL